MTAAERKRRQRERERELLSVYSVEVDDLAVTDMLIGAGHLQRWELDEEDRKAKVSRALGHFLNSVSRVTSAQSF
jgi:cytidylate kinase